MKTIRIIFLTFSILLIHITSFSQEKILVVNSIDSLNSKILKSVFSSKNYLDKNQLINHLDSIKKNLTNLGYLNAKIVSKKETDSILKITYSLNTKIKTTILTFFEEPILLKFIKTNTIKTKNGKIIIPFTQTNVFLKNLTTYYMENGYSFTKISLSNISIKKDTLFSKLSIQKTSIRYIDKFVINGSFER